LILRGAKRYPIHANIFKINFEQGGVAEVPKRGGDDNPVRLLELMGVAKARVVQPVFIEQSLALEKEIPAQKAKGFLHQADGLDGVILAL